MKNENKEKFLTDSTFCTSELIEKNNILRKRLSQDALSKVHWNKYGSYFKFILLLSGDINLNPGPTTPTKKWYIMRTSFFPQLWFFYSAGGYQLDPLSVVSNDAWNIFKKRGMHLIHLNISSLLPKIDETRYIAKLTNATIIGLSETKLDNTVLSSEIEIEGYDPVISDQSWRERGVACFVKNSISYNRKPNFCIYTERLL